MAATGAIQITSTSGALTVTFIGPAGGTPTVYSDAALTTTVSLPATVASATTSIFYVASPGAYTLSVKTASGSQIAAPGNTTRTVNLQSPGTVASYSYDIRTASPRSDSGLDEFQTDTEASGAYVPFPLSLPSWPTVYVNPNGSDLLDGKTTGTPVATLAQAKTLIDANSNVGTIVCSADTHDFSTNIVLGQGQAIVGTQNPFSTQGTILRWTGADDSTYAITTARDISGADNTGGICSNFRLIPNATKPGGGAYTAKSGFHWRNPQNNATLSRLLVTGFPGTGLLCDAVNGVVASAYPGYVRCDQVWVSNCGVNWHFYGGFSTVKFSDCASDFGALTTDLFIIDPVVGGASAVKANYVFDGFKMEYNGSADQDVNYITINSDVNFSWVGGYASKITLGTKPLINYTATPTDPDIVSGTIPVVLINVSTQTIAKTVVGPTGATLLAPPTAPASGIPFQISSWNGQAASSITPIGASLLTAGVETISRLMTNSSAAISLSSGNARFSYFTAPKTMSASNLTVRTGSTAAGATPTVAGLFLCSVAANGDLTVLGVTTNDTTLFAATSTFYTKAMGGAVTLVAGQRYAIGALVVTAAAAPNLTGCTIFAGIGGAGDATWISTAPVVVSHIGSQAALPAVNGTFAHGSLLYGDTGIYYCALT